MNDDTKLLVEYIIDTEEDSFRDFILENYPLEDASGITEGEMDYIMEHRNNRSEALIKKAAQHPGMDTHIYAVALRVLDSEL